MSDLSARPILRKPPWWLALLVCLALALVMGLVRRKQVIPIGYGATIVIAGWTRNRRLLWGMVGIFMAMGIYKFFFNVPAPGLTPQTRAIGLLLSTTDLIAVGWVVDALVRYERTQEARGQELADRNQELLQRREEIARQNAELSVRQGTLEALLQLSRSLTVGMSRDEVFKAICRTVQHLVRGTSGAVIWECRDGGLQIGCHQGFGDAGPDLEKTRGRKSFADTIIEEGRSKWIEEIAPDSEISIAQPKDGRVFKAVLGSPLKAGDRTIGALVIYSSDKRDWNSSEVALVESLAAQASVSIAAADLVGQIEDEQQRLQTILNTVPFGVLTTDGKATRLTCNPAAARMLDFPGDARLPRSDWPRMTVVGDNGEIPDGRDPLLRALGGESVAPAEFRVHLADGRSLITLSSAAPIRDRSGAISAAVAAFVDITAQKSLQEELDRRRREAEEATIRKSRFLAAVSHDIRTPANAISLLADLIQRSVADPVEAAEIPELARELQRSSTSLVSLVSDVLDLTRLDIGRVELRESEFELNAWLTEQCRQLQPLAEARKLKFSCSPLGQSVRLRCDRIKLSRVMTNLIGNAIKFTEKGQVCVEATLLADRRVHISVADTGIGIAGESLSMIFDEFAQLKSPEREKSTGSGLGLSISKRLVDVMGGSLDVVSEPGRGSTFSVTLPSAYVIQ